MIDSVCFDCFALTIQLIELALALQTFASRKEEYNRVKSAGGKVLDFGGTLKAIFAAPVESLSPFSCKLHKKPSPPNLPLACPTAWGGGAQRQVQREEVIRRDHVLAQCQSKFLDTLDVPAYASIPHALRELRLLQ